MPHCAILVPHTVKPKCMATAAASAPIGEHNEAIYGGELGLSQRSWRC